ncbi:acetolactate decarboxylase [Edaphobacter modestus]|uniref:Alpha-acetolactate decarboxylase n=1 Tax=Edaphobacter modestus TaxID=388466 RepID=A0A4Q7YN30_9BACT|nr:acetolactate decarboxylase [Edaphobacter modestus]RZU38790.1 acetolactate decarboxylase [Edaphobacter modestus]
MKIITCNVPDSLYNALLERMETDKASCDHVVSMALSQCLGHPIHTLFQVSTSAALVEGLYQGAVRVSRVLCHGNFGLGTFIDLDGEMVVLEGVCYRVASNSVVTTVEGDRLIPYAVVTCFSAEFGKRSQQLNSFSELIAVCDALHSSENVFYAFRVEGTFSFVKTRVMKAVPQGTGLKSASSGQKEFTFEDQEGTLIGLWSPGFAGSFSVPGYHFHFLSADRKRGGHVLECRAVDVTIGGCAMHEMHVSLPETAEFLKANLSHDPSDDLISAERNHES